MPSRLATSAGKNLWLVTTFGSCLSPRSCSQTVRLTQYRRLQPIARRCWCTQKAVSKVATDWGREACDKARAPAMEEHVRRPFPCQRSNCRSARSRDCTGRVDQASSSVGSPSPRTCLRRAVAARVVANYQPALSATSGWHLAAGMPMHSRHHLPPTRSYTGLRLRDVLCRWSMPTL